jgi:hypothetical protein
MAASEGDTGSKGKTEEDFSLEAADQKANELMAGEAAADVNEVVAADVDECSDDDDPVIRNLNRMSMLNLMTPEWIENRKKLHYEHLALYHRVYDALENGEIESDSDDDQGGAAELGKRIWASVDLSGLNTVDGEYAVAVHPDDLNPEEKDHDAAAQSSS